MDNSLILKTITDTMGRNIRILRERGGMTRQELSDKIGLSEDWLRALEEGINREIPYDAAYNLLLLFKIHFRNLLDENMEEFLDNRN